MRRGERRGRRGSPSEHANGGHPEEGDSGHPPDDKVWLKGNS